MCHSNAINGFHDNNSINFINEDRKPDKFQDMNDLSTLKTKVCLFSLDLRILSQIYCHRFNSKGYERDSRYYQTISVALKRKVEAKVSLQINFPLNARDLKTKEILGHKRLLQTCSIR